MNSDSDMHYILVHERLSLVITLSRLNLSKARDGECASSGYRFSRTRL